MGAQNTTPRVRVVEADRVAALRDALRACKKADFETLLAKGNRIRLELPGQRVMSCALLPLRNGPMLNVAGLGDFHARPRLTEILTPLVSQADWDARRRNGRLYQNIGAGALVRLQCDADREPRGGAGDSGSDQPASQSV